MRTIRRIVLVLAAIMVGLVGPAGARADGILGGLVSAPGAPATPAAAPQATLPTLVQTVTQPAVTTVATVVQTVTQPALTTVPTVVQTVTQPAVTTVPTVVQAATEPVQTLPTATAQAVGTVTQTVQAVADAVQTAAQPVAPVVQPVTATVTTTVAGIAQTVPAIKPAGTHAGPTAGGPISPPKLTPVAPSRQHASSGGGAAQEQPVAVVGGAAVTPSEARSVDRLHRNVGKLTAIPLRPHSGGPLAASKHPRLSVPRATAALGATPRVRVGPIAAQPTLAPAPDAGQSTQPRASLLGVTIDRSDASAAMRFGFLWVAAFLLAIGAAPTRAAAVFGRWPSLAFDQYRPYALGAGIALLVGVAITGL